MVSAWSLLMAAPAAAAPAEIDIPAADLPAAIVALARQTGISVAGTDAIPHRRTRRLRGRMDAGAALARLLAGSGLRAVAAGPGLWRLEPVPPPDAAPPAPFDVIILATKRAERLDRAPIAISIIRPDAASLPAGRGVIAALAGAEGVFATNLGPGRDRMFLRGVADSAFNGTTQSTVSLFLDDTRVSYATPDPDLRLADVERVEVLRGPQGTLYGTGALGGIVRIVTARPDPDAFAAHLMAEASGITHGGAGGGTEAMANVPMASGRIGLRLVGWADSTPGWIDDRGRGAGNINRVDRYGGRLALRLRAGDDWTVDAGLTGQWIDARDSQYATSGLARATALPEPHDNEFIAASLTIRGRIADLDFLSATAFVHHDMTSRFDASALPPAGTTAPVAWTEHRLLGLGTQEWRVSDQASARPWVAGLSLLFADNRQRSSFTAAAGESGPDRRHVNSLEAAAFGEMTQPLGPRLALTLGLRGFAARDDNEQRDARQQNQRFGLTPSATLSWSPAADRLLWLRYASAVRPGGLNPAGAGAGSFRSDDLRSIEFGWRLGAGPLRLDGAAFALWWENVQSDTIGPDGLVRTINAGTASNFGLELGATLALGRVTLDAALTVQRARLIDPSAAAGAISGDDSRLPVVPDLAGRVRAALDLPLAGLPLHWSGTLRHVGPARLGFDRALTRSMGGYWLVDAAVSVRRGRWQVALSGTNLADSRGDSFSFGNPFSIRAADQHTPPEPRMLTLRIAMDFPAR